jgi:hypothetical protein
VTATQRVGSRPAVAAVGPTRKLAADAVPDGQGPSWWLGLFVAILTLELVVGLELLLTTVWADAAMASKVAQLDGGITLFPGLQVHYRKLDAGGGFVVGADLGPMPLVVAALAFIGVARPWRLQRRR